MPGKGEKVEGVGKAWEGTRVLRSGRDGVRIEREDLSDDEVGWRVTPAPTEPFEVLNGGHVVVGPTKKAVAARVRREEAKDRLVARAFTIGGLLGVAGGVAFGVTGYWAFLLLAVPFAAAFAALVLQGVWDALCVLGDGLRNAWRDVRVLLKE